MKVDHVLMTEYVVVKVSFLRSLPHSHLSITKSQMLTVGSDFHESKQTKSDSMMFRKLSRISVTRLPENVF